MVPLPPTEFTYSNYGSSRITWSVIKTTKNYIDWLLAQNVIGYCDSMEIDIRPRSDEMAVMFEVDGWRSWNHIPIDIWKQYLKQLKSEK